MIYWADDFVEPRPFGRGAQQLNTAGLPSDNTAYVSAQALSSNANWVWDGPLFGDDYLGGMPTNGLTTILSNPTDNLDGDVFEAQSLQEARPENQAL